MMVCSDGMLIYRKPLLRRRLNIMLHASATRIFPLAVERDTPAHVNKKLTWSEISTVCSQQTEKQDATIILLLANSFHSSGTVQTQKLEILTAVCHLGWRGWQPKNFPWHIEAKEPHGINTPCF